MSQENNQRLVLIDGYSFLFRAYHSMPPLTNPDGLVVGALYGYSNMLFKVRSELDASHFAVILDHGEKTFRSEIYKEYKANRPPAPEDLVPQFPLVREVTEAMHIPALEQEGVEADDIIATLALRAANQNMDVTIISSDKDLMQLVGDRVKMYDPMKQKIVDSAAVFEKYGVQPNKMLDLLSLSGDSADNIPGVPGIGPKTAAELINNFGSLQGIYENLEQIKQPKRRETLTLNQEQAFLSEKLVKLKEDVAIIDDFKELLVKEIDKEKLGEFCAQHGFKALLGKLGATIPSSKTKTDNSKKMSFKEIKNDQELIKLFELLSESYSVFITYIGDDLVLANDVSVYLCKAELEAKMDLLGMSNDGFSADLLRKHLTQMISDKTIRKTFFDYKSFMRRHDDLTLPNELFIQNKLEDKNIIDFKTLAYIAQEKIDDDFISAKGEVSSELIKSRCQDVFNSIAELLKDVALGQQFSLLYDLDLPFNDLLLKAEKAGFKISQDKLISLTNDFQSKITVLEGEIFKIAGEEFNIGSPKQLGEILFEKMGLEASKKNKKTKSLSTSHEVLEDLAIAGNVIAEKVLEWRHYSKLKSTYTEALPKQINKITGRVHTTLSNTTTSTGRLSSNNPNLQNIPVRSKEGDLIREAFICEPDNVLISADYSQIELRLLAEIAGVTKLKEAFLNGKDIHAATASEVFNVPLDKVDAEFRRKAKTINFGIIYGISAFGLANRLKISRSEAKEFIELYFSRYPEIKAYMESIVETCRKQGYVETIFGRKLYFPNINASNPMLKNFTERAVINAPLQGSAADIIKKAMLELDEHIVQNNLPMRLILQVHDELIYEVNKDFAEEATKLVKKFMESAVKLGVSLLVDANSGSNWHLIH